MKSPAYINAVNELYHWLGHEMKATNFHSLLYHLITHADPGNRHRIALAFPNEVQAWNDWQKSDDQENFFKEYGLP